MLSFGNPLLPLSDLLLPGSWLSMPGRLKVGMFVNSDFTDLLNIFNANKVKYLIIGGYAVIQYAEPRFTKDLDIFISVDQENAKNVYRSLKNFGVPLSGLDESDFMEEGHFYQMGRPPVRVDILMGVDGIDFLTAWSGRNEVDFDGLVVPFISKEHLIQVKRAAGRPQDLLDADSLEDKR